MTHAFQFDLTRKSICQGDMYLIPIQAIPTEARAHPHPAEAGHHIITHSETSHHHVIPQRPDIAQYDCPPGFAEPGMEMLRGFLEISGTEPAELVHLRDHHTHAPQTISPGAWLIQRQGAYTPQGWERARD